MYMIDKDAVLNMIDINIEPHTHGAWDSGYNVALSEMREKIKQMPTVEAEPIHENSEKDNPESEVYCYDCIHNEVCQYCPHDGCDFKEKAEPVKHGRWETWGYIFHGITWKRCSVCGKTADVSYQALLDGKIEMATPSICGCCSARMDGDSE